MMSQTRLIKRIANPLNAVDKIWKGAAGPTQTTRNPSMSRYSGPPIQLAGTKPKKSAIPPGKI